MNTLSVNIDVANELAAVRIKRLEYDVAILRKEITTINKRESRLLNNTAFKAKSTKTHVLSELHRERLEKERLITLIKKEQNELHERIKG